MAKSKGVFVARLQSVVSVDRRMSVVHYSPPVRVLASTSVSTSGRSAGKEVTGMQPIHPQTPSRMLRTSTVSVLKAHNSLRHGHSMHLQGGRLPTPSKQTSHTKATGITLRNGHIAPVTQREAASYAQTARVPASAQEDGTRISETKRVPSCHRPLVKADVKRRAGDRAPGLRTEMQQL